MKLSSYKNRFLLSLLTIFWGAALVWFGTSWADSFSPPKQAPSSVETGTPSPRQRLSRPKSKDPGAQLYWSKCLVCHGDQGQGLTEDWLALLEQTDLYCLPPDCDVTILLPEGFTLPATVRPLIGTQALLRFDNAGELYRAVLDTMPRQEPGTLTADEAWAVTYILLQANHALIEGVTLVSENAVIVALHSPPQPRRDERPGTVFLASSLALAGGILAIRGGREP